MRPSPRGHPARSRGARATPRAPARCKGYTPRLPPRSTPHPARYSPRPSRFLAGTPRGLTAHPARPRAPAHGVEAPARPRAALPEAPAHLPQGSRRVFPKQTWQKHDLQGPSAAISGPVAPAPPLAWSMIWSHVKSPPVTPRPRDHPRAFIAPAHCPPRRPRVFATSRGLAHGVRGPPRVFTTPARRPRGPRVLR